jgi:hypothetical protein
VGEVVEDVWLGRGRIWNGECGGRAGRIVPFKWLGLPNIS